MTTTSKYNRSEIMKRAWQLKGFWKSMSFGHCLSRAWSEAKKQVAFAEKRANEETERMRMYAECARRNALMTDAEKQRLHEEHMLSFHQRGMYTGV